MNFGNIVRPDEMVKWKMEKQPAGRQAARSIKIKFTGGSMNDT